VVAGLFERESELAALGAAARDAAAGRGVVATVSGPAGGGKTRLLDAAEQLAADAGLATLRATASELTQQVPLALAQELLAPAVRARPAAARRRLLSGRASPAAPLFGLGSAGSPPGAEAVLALAWLIGDLAEEQPLALLVDDAQWADAATLDLLAHVGARAADDPLLLVVASRPPADADDVRVRARLGGLALTPAPLSTAGAAALLRERLGRKVADAFAAACQETTAGNPFYLDELARTLDSEGIRPSAEQASRVRALGTTAIASAVLVQLARLPAGATSVARALAILGDGAQIAHIAELARVSRGEADAIVAGLVRAEILADAARPAYRHPIVRASVIADLTAAERAAWHGRAATVLHADGVDAPRVAAHLLESEPAGEWETDALRAAAATARERGSPGLAARLLRRALRKPGRARMGVRLELGVAAFAAGEPDALEHLEAAHTAARSAAQRARVALELAHPLTGAGRTREAVELLRAATTRLRDSDPLRTELDAMLAAVGLLDGRAAAEVVASLTRRAELPAEGPAGRRMLANLSQCTAMTGAPAQDAAALALRAVADESLVVEAGPGSPEVVWAANVLIAADRFLEADAVLATALAEAQRRGSVSGFVVASMMRSLSAYRQGELEAAVAEARGATDAALDHGWGPGLPATVGFLVDALIERGDLDEAAASLARAGIADEVPDSIVAHAFLVARGRLKLARGDVRSGVEDLLELGRRSESDGWSATIGTPTFRTYAAPALATLGDREQAEQLAADELRVARAWGAPRAIGTALRVSGLVSGKRELLEQAVDTLTGTAARLEHARALADLGAARRRAGLAAEAREPLREAATRAAACGAAPLLAFARDELAATGARRTDRTLLAGVDALTPSERRVARLAADGLSNREIAQTLFLTRKTIEMHLGRAYRKLDIHSRGELAERLRS